MKRIRHKGYQSALEIFSLGVSYNQPRFAPNVTWNPNATTFIGLDLSSSTWTPGIFINSNNTAYITDPSHYQIEIWPEGSSVPARNITTPNINGFSIFVDTQEDIYIYGCLVPGTYFCSVRQIYKWTNDPSVSRTGFTVTSSCHEVFIDMNNTLYCSMSGSDRVSIGSLTTGTFVISYAVGSGSPGSGSNDLNCPTGIFVDADFILYVADTGNNRIQRFISGQSSGTTLAGTGAPGTIALSYPFDVVLDGDGYLFIADTYNNRIVGSGPCGFRCLVGCSQLSGLASDRLGKPYMLALDGDGNIYVSDTDSNRIQKFSLLNKSHGTSRDKW